MTKTILDYVDASSMQATRTAAIRVQEFHQAIPGLSQNTSDESAKRMMTAAEWEEYSALRNTRELAAANLDLYSLLAMRRSDGLPVWSIVNPKWATGNINGGCWTSSWRDRSRYNKFVVMGNHATHILVNIDKRTCKAIRGDDMSGRNREPVGGFPALPPRIRELLKLEVVQNCQASVILYQPNAWGEIVHTIPHPDPALLIKRDALSPFQCLAVWGHDGPLIHEFTL